MQQRIVAKLDNLFTHLEEVKTRLEGIPQLLKEFRQSVLSQAVTGKLTGGDFKFVKVSKVLKLVGGGTPSKAKTEYWNGDIPWASVKDFKEWRVLTKTQDFITKQGLDNSSATLADKGELLLITRMSPGRTIITDMQVAINQDLKIVRPKIDLELKFISYWFQSSISLIEGLSTGTTVKGIRVDVLNEVVMPIPTKNEQIEIVKKVESLFSKADAIQSQYEKLKQKIEDLPQAILAKAFRGELVEQLDSDGDARELLEEIKRLKKETVSKGKKIKKGR